MDLINKAEALRASSEFQQYSRRFGKEPPEKEITTEEAAREFCRFCQKLWEDLPNSPLIRYGPFFRICDLAEYHCFGE